MSICYYVSSLKHSKQVFIYYIWIIIIILNDEIYFDKKQCNEIKYCMMVLFLMYSDMTQNIYILPHAQLPFSSQLKQSW